MSEIKAVIFDAGGVLHESNSAITDDLAEELALEQAALEQIWSTQIPLLGSGKIDEAEFWRQVRDHHVIREVAVAENLLGRAFTEALTPHVPVLELIKQLDEKGLQLAVLSNTIKPHAKALREAGLYEGFNHLFLSNEVGLRKPEAEIYELALRTLAVKPPEAVFIDDNAQNVRAAETLGMHGIVYTNPEQLITEMEQLIPGLRV